MVRGIPSSAPPRNRPRCRRRFATFVMVVAILGCGVVGIEGGAAAADDAEWTVETVPGSELRFRHPATWVVPSSDTVARMATAMGMTVMGGDALIAVIDPSGANDNVVVNRFAGTDTAEWWSSFDEFEFAMRASARQSGGKVLGMGKRRVGKDPLYWTTERDPDPAGGPAVVFTEVEVRERKDSVVTFAISISTATHDARALTRRFIAGISAG